MILRKSKISYVFWGLFLILSISTLLISSIGFASAIGSTGDVLVIGIAFIAMILAPVLISFVANILAKRNHKDPYKVSTFMEVIVIFFIVILSVMLRFIYITFIDGVPLGDTKLFNLAINNDLKGAYSISNLDMIFAQVSSTFIQIIGSDSVVIMYINSVLQLFSIFTIYYVIKNYIGIIAGLLCAGTYAFLPYNIMSISQINAGQLLTFSFMVSILMIIYSQNKSIANELEGNKGLFTLVLAGIFSGFTAFLDVSGFILIIFGILIYTLYKKESVDFVNKTSTKIVALIAGFVVTFLALFIYSSKYSGLSYIDCLLGYFTKLSNVSLNLEMLSPAYQNVFAPIVICLSLLWLFRFFNIERELGSAMIVIPFTLSALSIAGLTNADHMPVITCFWSIMAGIGMVSLGKNSLEYFERERIKKEEAEAKRRERLEKQKQELEKKKAELEAKKRITKDVYTKPVITTVNVNPSSLSDNTDVASLEATLDFLKKPSENTEKVSETVSVSSVRPNNGQLSTIESEKVIIKKEILDEEDNTKVTIVEEVQKTDKKREIVPRSQDELEKIKDSEALKSDIIAEIRAEVTGSPVKPVNPATKYGRRSDYRTAKVSSATTVSIISNPAAKNETVSKAAKSNIESKTADSFASSVASAQNGNNNSNNNNNNPSIQLIHNPLPQPKKKNHVEFDFDYAVSENEMKFDIVDLNGKDHFDLN